MEVSQFKGALLKHSGHGRLNLRWVFVCFLLAFLVIAVLSGFSWLAQITNDEEQKPAPRQVYEASLDGRDGKIFQPESSESSVDGETVARTEDTVARAEDTEQSPGDFINAGEKGRAEQQQEAYEPAIADGVEPEEAKSAGSPPEADGIEDPVSSAGSQESKAPLPQKLSSSSIVDVPDAPNPQLSSNSAIVKRGDQEQAPQMPPPTPAEEQAAVSEEKSIYEGGKSETSLKQDDHLNDTTVNSLNGSKPNRKPRRCNLFKGKWIPSSKPLYTNETCPYIQPDQNCIKNGHPAVKNMFMRWKPQGCKLPRFDAKLFLQLQRGKVWAYIGDSLARNQMQSMLCMLSQVENPNNTFSDRPRVNVHWHFPSYDFTLIVRWSPYLVTYTDEEFKGLPKGSLKLHLDQLDSFWLNSVPKIDVIILSTGHWLLKPAAYIVANEVIGCHHCGNNTFTTVPPFFAYEWVLRSSLAAIKQMPGFSGTVFLRTHSLSHFEHGHWDTGGSCNRTAPFEGKTLESRLQDLANSDMYRVGVQEFKAATNEKKAPNSSQIKLLDITYLSFIRPDGHPGKFRDKAYQLSVDAGQKVPNDCLHWCLPGPVDAWNEILLQMIQDVS